MARLTLHRLLIFPETIQVIVINPDGILLAVLRFEQPIFTLLHEAVLGHLARHR